MLITDDYTITITGHRMIQPGEKGNEYGGKPVLAFWYDTTNTGSDSLNPLTAWLMGFETIQNNTPNAVHTLLVAPCQTTSSWKARCRTARCSTISSAVAYELDDSTTPVTLVAENILGGEYGQQEFSLAS